MLRIFLRAGGGCGRLCRRWRQARIDLRSHRCLRRDEARGQAVIFHAGKARARACLLHATSSLRVVQPGGMPLNRVAKPDYLCLRDMAEREIAELREKGKWDRM